MTSIAFGKAEHILSIGQAIAMHTALEKQRQLTVGKKQCIPFIPSKHYTCISRVPQEKVRTPVAINAALSVESKLSLCTT